MPGDLLMSQVQGLLQGWSALLFGLVFFVAVIRVMWCLAMRDDSLESLLLPVLFLGGVTIFGAVFVPMVLTAFQELAPARPLVVETTVPPSDPMDWSGVWTVLSWVGTIGGLVVVIGLLVKLPHWAWAAFVWWCNPVPAWASRWLGRPVWTLRPRVRQEPPEAPGIYVVPDDPIMEDIDRAIRAIDAMLTPEPVPLRQAPEAIGPARDGER